MSGIKPAEVSEILKKELEGLANISEFEEVGVVLEVGDGIARIYGLTNVQSGELIEFENSTQAIVLNLEEVLKSIIESLPSYSPTQSTVPATSK